MQSDGRIGNLEKDFTALNGAYSYILNQVTQLTAQPVFASGDNQSQSQFQSQSQSQPQLQEQSQSQGQYVNNISAGNNGQDLTAVVSATNSPEISFTEQAAATPAPTLAPTPAPAPSQTPAGTQIVLPQATIPPSLPMTLPISTARPTPGNSGNGSEGLHSAYGDDDEDFGTYIVQRGDTLSGICYVYYGTTDMIEKVMQVNGINHADTIFFGKVLRMPKMD